MTTANLEADMSDTIKITKRALASTAALSVLLVPSAANARIIGGTPGGERDGELAAASYTTPSTSSGFQWEDAAIGAAGALGVAAIAGASGRQIRRRRVTAS